MGMHHHYHEHVIIVNDKQPHPSPLHCQNIEPPQPRQMKNKTTRTKY